jgi:hypothetical protein
MEMAGLRPAMRSAVMRAEPCDMARVEDEVREPPPAEQREIGRRHRPQAGAHFGAIVLGAVGIEPLGHALHEGEIGRLVARVVAGELRRRGDAETVAETRNGDEIVLVDAGDRRRRGRCADGYGQRVALDGIDGQADAKSAREKGALSAQRQHIGVGGERSAVG